MIYAATLLGQAAYYLILTCVCGLAIVGIDRIVERIRATHTCKACGKVY